MASEPRFSVGQSVRDRWGTIGTIATVHVSLAAAEAAGVIVDAEEWLAQQERPPKTDRDGYWYTVKPKRGALLCGEDDLEPVSVAG